MNPIELSIEFFPPQTQDGVEKLRVVREKPEGVFRVDTGLGSSTP